MKEKKLVSMSERLLEIEIRPIMLKHICQVEKRSLSRECQIQNCLSNTKQKLGKNQKTNMFYDCLSLNSILI